MGFSSQAGQVLVRTQAVPGVYQADTGTAGLAMRLRSGAFGPNRDLMIPDPEIGGGRDVADANLGTVSWSGDFEFYARINSFLTLAYACLGIKDSPAAVDGVATHTITPSDASQLPFLSVEERIGANFETYHYTDVVVNTLHLEAEANGYLMGTVGLIAAKQLAGATPTAAPVWDTTPMYVGSNIVVMYNGVSLPAKNFSLDINNNFEDDDFRLGSFYIGDLSPKRREITATFNIRESSSALWRQAVYGTSGSTTPTGLTEKFPLEISIQSYEDIPDSVTPTKYSLDLAFPKFALTPYSLSVSGDDIIDDDLSGQALRPDQEDDILTIVAKTELETIA